MPLGLKVKTRLTRRRRGRKVLAPKVSASVKCGTCHKRMANPLTHVCTIKTDFKKRQAAAGKKPRKPPHSPSACRDDECRQRGCEGYKLGYEEGYADGAGDR